MKSNSAMLRRSLARPWVRAVAGMTVSAAFVVATFRTVDGEVLADAWSSVALAGLVLAAALSVVEVAVRGLRWRILLSSLGTASFGLAIGYLAIGHLANAILPARLGDLARALFTGVRLRVSRTSVLGTIAVERVSDAGLLAAAAAVGVLIGYRQLALTLAWLAIAALVATACVAVAYVVLTRQRVTSTRVGSLLREYAGHFWTGATGLRTWRDVTAWAALTVSAFALTVSIFLTVSAAVGLTVPPWQAALIVAAVTLSTAIPAGPASIGTYEFVGMTVMVSMGQPAEQALLAVALVHAIAVVPAALMGLVAMWWLGVRPHAPKLASYAPTAERP